MPASLQLPEVDQVEILTVLHNSLDLLMAGSETARRVPLDGTVGEGRSILRLSTAFRSSSRS
jgi:hypothetical protein